MQLEKGWLKEILDTIEIEETKMPTHLIGSYKILMREMKLREKEQGE